MTRFGAAVTALSFCLAGCGEGTDNAAEGGNGAAAGAGNGAAAVPTGVPAAATAGAETPVGPCPFATRGWEATVIPASAPGESPTVSLNGEIRADSGGRPPMISTQTERQPPVLVLELLSDAAVEPQADRGWIQNGGVFDDYAPEFTHAAVRCANVEIARVPIRPAG